MPINFENIQISGGITFIPEILTPSGDPYWANVSLLMNTTSTNNQTNNTFLDGSTNNFTVTRNGTPTQGSFTPFTVAPNTSYNPSINGGSGLFSAGQLSLTEQTISGDFTAECWFYRTGNAANYSIIFGGNAGTGGASNCQLSVYNDGSVAMVLAAAVVIGLSGTAVTTNQWHHIAWVKSGTSAAVFVNGVRQGTGTTSSNLIYQAISGAAGVGSGFYAQGYISSCRVVNGAVYDPTQSTITVPTTPLTNITNTNLLLNFTNGGMYDAATKNNLTTLANAAVSTTQAKWSPTSLKLAGGTDELTIPSSSNFNFGSGDFTIEAWIYVSAYVSSSAIISKGVNGPFLIFIGASNEISFYSSTNGSGWAVSDLRIASAPATNTWHYIAVTRAGTTVRTFFNGVLANSTTLTGAVVSNATDVSVGRYSSSFNGYIQDLRVTKGVARYTANFTPPTTAFPTN